MKKGARKFRPDIRGSKFAPVDTGLNHCLKDFCRGTVDKKKEHSPLCSRCRNFQWREKYPLHYSFKNLRARARQRGKDFTLTREQYIEFAVKTDYARLKGTTALSLSIDRIENGRGYHADNIQAITLSQNSRKQFVSFFANQQENISYKPTEEELAEISSQITDEN